MFIFIPVVVAILLLCFWLRKVVWWEIAALIAPSAIIILLMNTIMVHCLTDDIEYLGFYTTKVTYYEPWDEEVPCRHPIYCTRSYPCGKSTCTQTYICGYYHAYDVDYHPEKFSKTENDGSEISISKDEYSILKNRFATKEYFIELNRDYHSIDGDAYSTNWGGEPERSDVITRESSYTNKIKASHSIFKFEDISQDDAHKIHLYDYPQVQSNRQSVALGCNLNSTTERKLQYLNGFYGSSKQFKMFILFYRNQSMDIAFKQKSYWEGGNKNEFVICIGVNDKNNLDWVKCFSWMDKPELEVRVEEYLSSQDSIDLDAFADWMPEQIEQHWHRKNFDDFDYLQVELTQTQLIWIMIVIMLYNIIASFWIVLNEIENDRIDRDREYGELYTKIQGVKNKILSLWKKFVEMALN